MGLVVVSDRSPEFIGHLETLLEREEDLTVASAASAPAAVDLAVRENACVVVFGPSVKIDVALAAGEELTSRPTPIGAVLVAPKVTPELLRMAMRAGFRDVVASEGTTYGDVGAAIRDAHDIAARSRAAGGQAAHPETPTAPRESRIVTVFGNKGGVGKTVVATNMGVALAKDFKKDVVLVDLDLESGDAAIMLKLEPKRTIFDAAQAIERLDAAMLKNILVEHSSGLKVLLAPRRSEDAESVTTARISRIIGLLSEMFDVVIIDTAGRFDEAVLTAIDRSDEVLAVATMEVPSIKNTKVSLEKLEQLGYRDGGVRLVLNRADSKVFIEPGEVEKAIGGKISARIPSDRAVPRSVNKGVPVVLDAPKSAVARSLVELARTIVETG
ncbi:MAG: AAA family ATPase [Anaerosomatales bacterium]|nr:AAA family ATPase [Anaerosomatales bacterium]MDT8434292.1 AAA family ATPase [Anaerosomatales bacterium]